MVPFASLCANPLVFEPISTMNSVFYDPANNQVFTLRARGAMGVNVKSLESPQTSNFRINDKGEVLSIKFDPTNTILSLQRKRNCVDFINFENGRPEDTEYSQTSKKPNSMIFGFVWSRLKEIIFITNEGFELYQVHPDNHSIHTLKHGSVQTLWYAWDPLNKVLLLSTGDAGNRLHVTSFENGLVTKYSSFEVPEEEILPPSLSQTSKSSSKPYKTKRLQQKNCLLANLYGQLYACILSLGSEVGVQLVLYQLMRRGPVRRRHILVVPEVGCIAVNYVRDLVLVHHQHSRTTLAYDIASAGVNAFASVAAAAPIKEESGEGNSPRYHYPILPPVSLSEVSIPCKTIPALSVERSVEFSTPLYAPSWIVFPPNVVIDGSLGCLWTVDVNLEAFTKLITDPIILVDCLLNRPGAKPVLRGYCQEMVEKLGQTVSNRSEEVSWLPSKEGSLTKLLEVIRHLLSRFASIQKSAKRTSKFSHFDHSDSYAEDKGQASLSPKSICRPYQQPLVFSPDDVFETMFAPLASHSHDNPKIHKVLSHLILHYINELKTHGLFVDPMFYTLLMKSLIASEDFTRLFHLLRSGVIIDSTEIANHLLSIESAFPPAGQLAIDMLQRLATSNESIIEVFLAKRDPIAALRFCKDHRELLALSEIPRKVVDAAKFCDDPMIFYSVFRFFERAASLPCPLIQDPKLRPYVAHFSSLFGPCNLLNDA